MKPINMKTIALIVVSLVMLIPGIGGSPLKTVEKALDIELGDAEIISESDTHGGFLGDGETDIRLRVSSLPAELEDRAGWHPLPLPPELAEFGGPFAGAEEGLWYFRDRHSEASDPFDTANVNSRASWNFTLAIYDAAARALYFYEFDT